MDPLRELAGLLEEADVPYALIGGHAINVWLEPRFTADIDLTIEAGTARIDRLTQVLEQAGFAKEFVEGAGEPSGPDFVRFVSNDLPVVLEFQAAKTELQHQVILRAHSQAGALRVATAEDLIILKLIANRPKDQIDLIGLCGLPDLDWAYVQRWTQEWELSELLSRFRSSAED